MAATALEALNHRRHAQDLRETWQARALAHTYGTPLGAVMLSVLAHNFDEHMPTLLRVVIPGYPNVPAPVPMIASAARIAKNGAVVAKVVDRDGTEYANHKIYDSEIKMRDVFRRLADVLKFNDSDREQMFIAAQNWVVADRRLDPTMDPKDPDAKRLVVH